MVELAATIFSDGPSSNPSQPMKPLIRDWGTWLEQVILAFTSGAGNILKTSRAALFADLAHAASTSAWVMGDPNVAYNGIYVKSGASGTGSWARVSDLPFSFIIASDVGAGTPNAIQASTSIPVSGSALVWTNIFETNTASPVTISFNGGATLTIKTNSGNDPVPGGLPGGMIVMGTVSGGTFRLVNDQVSSAIVAAAEAAAAAAVAAKSGAEAALAAMQKGQPGGVAELDGNGRLPNGQLPPRIRAQASSVTANANTVLDSGWYYGWSGTPGGLTNYPDNSKTWLLEVIAADIAGYGRQIAYLSHVGAVFEKWERTIVAGTFSAWTRVYRTSVEIMQVISDNSECLLAQFGVALGPTDDWRPAFNAAVAKVATVSPKAGTRIVLPPKQIYLSYVDRILANGITFVGAGKTQIQSASDGLIIANDPFQPMFSWGSVGTETCGGGLEDISIECSAITWTGGHLIDCINARGPQFRGLWLRRPFNAMKFTGGNDVELVDNHVGGYRGEGVQIAGTDTLRGDRAVLVNNFIGGWSNDGVSAANIGPALYINGNWHSVYSTGRLEMVTVNEGVKIDSPYSDNAKMPQFIDIADLLVDYTTNNALSFNKGEHCWIHRAYMNGGQNNLIGMGVAAADLQISGGKIGFTRDRLGIIEGLGFILTGVDCHRWNQSSTSQPAFWIRSTANDVRFRDNMAGRTGKLAAGSEAGQKFVTVEGGANPYQADGNTFIGLHATPLDGTLVSGNRARA